MQQTRKLFTLILILYTWFSLQSCISFREKPRVIKSYFARHRVDGALEYYNSSNRKIYYAQAGNTAMPVVIFVHGSPGSLSSFVPFLVDSILLQRALLVTTDRPGFGYSHYGHGDPSLKNQAAIIADLIRLKKKDQPVFLVGHSLGGPLVARIAMDYPDIVDGIVVVAGAIDPDLEPNELWFRAPLASPFLNWMLPGFFRASNKELYHLKPQLQLMVPEWTKITCPAVIVHGRRDNLVPFGNVDFANKHLNFTRTKYILSDNARHFIPWEQPEMVSEGILHLLNQFSEQRKPVIEPFTAAPDSTSIPTDLH